MHIVAVHRTRAVRVIGDKDKVQRPGIHRRSKQRVVAQTVSVVTAYRGVDVKVSGKPGFIRVEIRRRTPENQGDKPTVRQCEKSCR